MSVEKGESSNHPARLAAELGIAGVGLAAAGFVAYRRHHVHDDEITHEQSSRYQDKLNIFTDVRVDRHLPNCRHIMAGAAVRIYYASQFSEARVLTKEQLWQQLHDSDDALLHISKHHLQGALGYLKDNGIIGRRPSELNIKSHGYYASLILEQAYADDNRPLIVAQADEQYWTERI